MDNKIKFKIVQWKSGSILKNNLDFITAKINETEKNTIIIFPEYSMLYPDYSNPEAFMSSAQSYDDSFIGTISEAASNQSVDVVINFVEKNYGKPLNTSLHINSSERISGRYSKIHLFDSYGFSESRLYERGNKIPEPFLIHGKVPTAMEICYDIRFPEISRLYSLQGAYILIVQAGFYRGHLKYETWATLLRARAMENGIFVLAADQCGEDFIGHSMVVDPYGQILMELDEDAGDLQGEIDLSKVDDYRDSVPVIRQRRIDLYDVHGL
ncbi:nitrilase-related carbon-nitrogen hydrolase [Cuniculiplasma sp. SKW3]|uniref:nitrilase-related carbon-nitrogen hydrolase n=1 Tax=Cuniculiplasma sp. SKW3 TaxID=3400170 RepID=UPI003FD34730